MGPIRKPTKRNLEADDEPVYTKLGKIKYRATSTSSEEETNMDQQPGPSTNANVPTSNRFGILPVDPTEEPATVTQNTPTRPPPIMVTAKVNYNQFKQTVSEILQGKSFYLRYTPRDIKIYTDNIQDHNTVRESLDEEKVAYYTYSPRTARQKRVVFKGPPDMDTEVVKQILNQEHKISECIKMKARQGEGHSYLVTAEKETNIGLLKRTRNIEHSVIKWETFHKRSTITQCHRCQGLGHGSRNCRQLIKCLKCAGPHAATECRRRRGENEDKIPMKCANCNEGHAANYRGCKFIQEYLAKSQPKKFESNRTQQGRTYSQATGKVQEQTAPLNRSDFPELTCRNNQANPNDLEDFQTLMKEIDNLNKKFNIKDLISQVRTLNTKLSNANNQSEIIQILASYGK